MSIFNRKKPNEELLIEDERKNILGVQSSFRVREAYNRLRSNIMFSIPAKGTKFLALTSTMAGEGKSINTLNIAISFAEIGKKVLVVDCDMRKPKLHRFFAEEAYPGLSNFLVGDTTIFEAIREKHEYGIDIMCSGSIPPDTTKLLESETFAELVEQVKNKYDYVIFDTPPVNIVIDACIIAKHTNGIIYVIKQNYANKDRIKASINQIKLAGGEVIGFLLNGIKSKEMIGVRRYSYERGYGKYGKYGRYGRYGGYRYGGYRYGSYGGYGGYGGYDEAENKHTTIKAEADSSKNEDSKTNKTDGEKNGKKKHK